MRMKRAIAAACAAILLALPLTGCGEPYAPAEDEIALQIQLDLNEEIGLLIIDYAAGESSGSGGVSNADKSPLKRDELLFYTLERRFFDDPAAVDSLRLTFTVITEYQEPNYENVYKKRHRTWRQGLPHHASLSQQIIKKLVKVFVEPFHQVTTYYLDVTVNKIKLRHVLAVVVFKHKAVRFQYAHIVNAIVQAAYDRAQHVSRTVVKVGFLAVNPVVNDTSCYLVVIVVKGQQLACVLRQA